MPPQRTQIACPRCRQPVSAQIEQLFDVTSDPGAKQRLLGGVSNYAACQSCGFSGPLSTPIVYHDADKELLLTFFPAELNMPVNEQEKLIGPLINQVTNRLPAEKRKGYLLRPQTFFTYQSLIEKILGADGITPEMIQAQQKRVTVIEQLLSASSAEIRSGIIKQNAEVIDADFFTIFSRLAAGAAAGNQDQAGAQLEAIQQQLLTETDYGKKIAAQANEVQEAVNTLQAAGKQLTREKLLDILIEAPNDERLNALVSMTRPGLDYMFFQALTDKIEKAAASDRSRLESLREKLLDLTRQIDQRLEEEYKHANDMLDKILLAADIQKATAENINEINDVFIQILNKRLQEANQKNDSDMMPKLQQVVTVLQKASAPPPELALLEELLAAPDAKALDAMIESHGQEITPEFSSIIASVLSRSEEQGKEKPSAEEAELLSKLEMVYRSVLRYSMKKSSQ
jgi:hypothetical protein